MTFYNCIGKPIAYTEDDGSIYLFSGEPVAYFSGTVIYGFNGKQLGWFENGWIRDLNGYCVFYSENASGSGPVKPVKNVCPVKSVKHIKPVKCVKQVKRVRAVNVIGWSSLSEVQFFQ